MRIAGSGLDLESGYEFFILLTELCHIECIDNDYFFLVLPLKFCPDTLAPATATVLLVGEKVYPVLLGEIV